MASKRFEIDMGLNASGVAKGAKDAERALADLEDAVEDIGRGGARDVDKLEDSLRDVQRQAARTEDALDDIGDTSKRSFDKAEDGLDNFKDEANQTARESAASFDGSAESIADAFQEVAANAFADFGPAGAAAGLAAAAGIGLVTAEIQKQQEEAEKLKQRLSDLYLEALESGRDYIDQSQFIAESNDLRFNPDRADEWRKLQADAVKLAIDENTLIKANSGDLEAQAEVFRRISAAKEDGTAYYVTERDGLERLKPEYQEMEDRWKRTREQSEQYAQAVKDAQASEHAFWQEVIASAGTASEEVDEFGNRLLTLPDGRQVLINAETGQATANVDQFKGDVDGIVDTVTTTAVFDSSRAQADIDRWVVQNNGRTIKINGRVEVSSGVPFE